MENIDRTFFIRKVIFFIFLFIATFAFIIYEIHQPDVNITEIHFFDIRWEVIIFFFTLIGIGVFYNRTTDVAIVGLVSLLTYKFSLDPEFTIESLSYFNNKMTYLSLINLAGLLLGFNILADQFLMSNVSNKLTRFIPNNLFGCFLLLFLIFVASTFLDDIAIALIGFSAAKTLYNGKLHPLYIISIVGAANAGGCVSVVGDTATTMFWLKGIGVIEIFYAIIPAFVAFLIFGLIGSRAQIKTSSINCAFSSYDAIDWDNLALVFLMLVCCIVANIYFDFPSLGLWIALFIGKFFVRIDWKFTSANFNTVAFLLILVYSATLIPLTNLPQPTYSSTFQLGIISAVFNNIPLARLCLDQGGYVWPLLSFVVGYGGTMAWFGSSAGVAVSDLYPKLKSFSYWTKNAWHVILAYVVGFWSYVFVAETYFK